MKIKSPCCKKELYCIESATNYFTVEEISFDGFIELGELIDSFPSECRYSCSACEQEYSADELRKLNQGYQTWQKLQ